MLGCASSPFSPVDTTDQHPLLERLFAECAEDLSRYFSRRHGVGEWVQDLVQETFLHMARGLQDGRQTRCARGYLFGIARHLSQAAWTEHSQDRHKILPFNATDHDLPQPAADDRVASARETILALEPLQREILDLRFTQGLSYAEIAEALGIPVGTVRSRLHHAVAEVRTRLESETL